MQRTITLIYIFAAAAFAVYVTIAQIQPALFFIEIFAPNPGDKFSLTLVTLLVFSILLIPVLVVQLMQRFLRKSETNVIHSDSSGVYVTRKKALQSGLIGIPIFINGKKVGVVDNGKTKFFEVPPGTLSIHAGKGRQATPEVSELLAEGEQLHFTVSFREAGLRVRIDLKRNDPESI